MSKVVILVVIGAMFYGPISGQDWSGGVVTNFPGWEQILANLGNLFDERQDANLTKCDLQLQALVTNSSELWAIQSKIVQVNTNSKGDNSRVEVEVYNDAN